jgi:hypothetical protein
VIEQPIAVQGRRPVAEPRIAARDRLEVSRCAE